MTAHDTSHPTRRRLVRTLALAAVPLTVAGALAACGDGDGDEPAALATGEEAAGAATLPEVACDAAVDLSSAMGEVPQDPAAVGAFVDERLVPAAGTLADELGGAAGDAARTVLDAYTGMARTGDPSTLGDPAVAQAQNRVGAAVHAGCDLERVDITAEEYAFVGAPDELPAGRVSFALENVGVEEHEMVLLRRADGVTGTFDEIAQLPEDQMMSQVTFTGVVFGAPGTTSYTAIDLEPGTYFLACFIPVGGAADGPPHFVEGMQHTIEVR